MSKKSKLGKSYATIFAFAGIAELKKKKKKSKKDGVRNNK